MRHSPEIRSTLDFRKSQRRSRWLTFLYISFFGIMSCVVAALIGFAATELSSFLENGKITPIDTIDITRFVSITAVVSLLIIVTAIVKSILLGSEGARIATELGATEITKASNNEKHKRYINIVEEIAIASSMPMPRVFVMHGERGINAFAAGSNPENAAVAVTSGALDRLSRDELAAVVAHEFSHIENYDTRLNGRIVSMIFALTILTMIGLKILQGIHGSSRKNTNMLAIMCFALLVIAVGWVGSMAGKIIQASVSRRREYLADATAVEYTRNQDAMARALKKVAEFSSNVEFVKSTEASHMFFASSTRSWFMSIFNTHPSIFKRIKKLDPLFVNKVSR